MGAENDSQSGHMDRLFEHRNKEYGAYALRKAYNSQLIKGSVGMCLVVVLCVGGYWWSEPAEIKEVAEFSFTGCSLELDVPIIPDTTNQEPRFRNMVPVIVADSIMEEPPDLEDELIGPTICEGVADDLFLPDLTSPEEFGTDAASVKDSIEQEIYCIPYNEELPQYPGGHEAMLQFIAKALGPPYALAVLEDSVKENLEKVVVLSQFRIDVDGRLTDIRFPRPAIEPYQTDVRRVLEAMPKWIPGMKNGKPFSMDMKLPIIFLLVEE